MLLARHQSDLSSPQKHTKHRTHTLVFQIYWDTDSNKSFDLLLNPICIMFVFQYKCTALLLCLLYKLNKSLNQIS